MTLEPLNTEQAETDVVAVGLLVGGVDRGRRLALTVSNTSDGVLQRTAARAHLEALMSTHTHGYLSEYAQKFVAQGEATGEARGEARGKAGAVLAVLDARGIAVPDAARTRIGECDDPHQLDVWVRRAASTDSVEDLFGDPRTAQH